jgi:putative ABC transport system permease protein
MQFLDELKSDVRYALRHMARTPVLTAVAIGVLAIGIGANSAVISFADTLLRPRAPGVENKDRLMAVEVAQRGRRENSILGLDFAEMMELRERQQVFAEVGAVMRQRVFAGRDITRDRQFVAFVSARYFAAIQPRMTIGRALAAPDDRSALPERSVVITHDYWRTKLGGDSSALGTSIYVSNVPMQVVGVLPEGFAPNASMDAVPDLWLPMASRALLFPNDSTFFQYARSWMHTVALP